ncbi:MAG: radical SAM/SPASM domain-containing protein [Thermodesulfobacteriota bacterium]
MYTHRRSETKVQSTFEKSSDFVRNEWRRARGKPLSYLWFKLRWNRWPAYRVVPKFPLNVDIEVSSACNLRCDHCFRQYMDVGENSLMPLDMFKTIARECGRYGLYTLKFSMRGEPTLHPQLPEMVAFAKENEIKEVWINTHGGNLTADLAERLMKAGPDWITVSFDGLGAMYESIRKPLKYEESLEKLKLLRRCRDLFHPGCLINVQTLWSAIKDDPEAYHRTMTPLVDRISFNADMNFKEIMLVPDDDFVCPRLWQRIAITSRGHFLKCPSDFQMEEILGNVSQMTIKEAWDQRQHQQRLRHLAGRKSESTVCRKCHHGAKKVARAVAIQDGRIDGFDIVYQKEFSGVGLNRQSDEQPKPGDQSGLILH